MIRLLLSAVAAVLLIGAAAAGPQEDCYQASNLWRVHIWGIGGNFLSPSAPPAARAIEACSEVLRSAPNDDKAYFSRGIAYAWVRNFDQAIADYTRVVEINSTARDETLVPTATTRAAIAYLNRGDEYLVIDLFDESRAIADINKAIELKPDYAVAYYIRGRAYENAGHFWDRAQNYPRALADYTKAIEHDPNWAVPYIFRGMLHGITGAGDRAWSDFDKAIEIDPMSAEAYYQRALVHIFIENNHDLARRDIAKAVAIDPKYVDIIKHGIFGGDYFPKDDSPPAGEAK